MATDVKTISVTSSDAGFVKGLGPLSATTLVMGSMIGSGIFIVSADIARLVDSPILLIGAWVLTGFLTITGALAYGELAAMMPHAGGQYVYLREAFGPFWGFLYGWTLYLVVQTGTIAAVGIAFGKFLGVFFPVRLVQALADSSLACAAHSDRTDGSRQHGRRPEHPESGRHSARGLSLRAEYLRPAPGRSVQNVFTIAKTAALLGLVLLGVFVGRNAHAIAANFGANYFRNAGWHSLHPVQLGVGGPIALVGVLTILAVAQTGSLFSSDAWNNITFTAAEVKNPKFTLPIALAFGTAAVTLLYVLANFVYLNVLPLQGDAHGATILARGIQHASEDRVATAVMEQMFGSAGAGIMAFAILVSTFGCNNGLILAGARVYYAMAKDGLFFRSAAKLHPRYHTPVHSLAMQCIWTCILCISGSYSQLLDYIIFAVLVFYILTIAGLFVLRVKRPDEPRPYRAIGYPVLPAMYIVIAVFIDIVLLRYKPQYTWPGLIIVLLGIPVYFLWSKFNSQARTQA